jgi:hypothetical protein
LSALITVQLQITRQANPGDIKGSWGPRPYGPPAPFQINIDQELEVPLVAGASNIIVSVPSLGAGVVPSIVLITSDTPGVTYIRNAESVPNVIGANGVMLAAGTPQSGVLLSQLTFSNPGNVAANVYVYVGA